MKFHPENLWFHSSEFMRACQAVHDARGSLNFLAAVMGHRGKYVQIYTDQRTGDFIIRDRNGDVLTHEEVYTLFPSLQDPVPVIVSAGVRPYPE